MSSPRERKAGPRINGYAWYVVAILTLAATISAIDRQILALMIGPIRRDLGVSDTQIALLMGAAFAVLHMLATFPIARLADRYSRKWIIVVGIFSWSMLTAASAMAHRYWPLFLARMGVGVSEASLTPAAYSMMSDYFPRERLPHRRIPRTRRAGCATLHQLSDN